MCQPKFNAEHDQWCGEAWWHLSGATWPFRPSIFILEGWDSGKTLAGWLAIDHFAHGLTLLTGGVYGSVLKLLSLIWKGTSPADTPQARWTSFQKSGHKPRWRWLLHEKSGIPRMVGSSRRPIGTASKDTVFTGRPHLLDVCNPHKWLEWWVGTLEQFSEEDRIGRHRFPPLRS